MTAQPPAPLRVTVWNENRHEQGATPYEQLDAKVAELYPKGMHDAIASGIEDHLSPEVKIRIATLDEPEHGLTEGVLAETDVLTWWGHVAHGEVSDEVVARVQEHVLAGMGLVVLHSGAQSKIFRRLMGTTGNLRWRSEHDRELVWTVNPSHPIAQGVPHPIVIDEDEMYGEFFDIPAPDELVFVTSFTGGEIIRSGCVFRRGYGKIFYFSPGDEAYPVYHHPDVRRVIANAVQWAAPSREQRGPIVATRSETGWFEDGEQQA
ncbi:ThuA domain-containing protein [Kribbella sp. NPDC050820]|uniref:ThuA domain-containing protein n=1 Tax=Kribbella sp. NPDC050820 TaxID=3155408 RepID=UPI0033DA9A9C